MAYLFVLFLRGCGEWGAVHSVRILLVDVLFRQQPAQHRAVSDTKIGYGNRMRESDTKIGYENRILGEEMRRGNEERK